ncbi:hypothetical protein [Serratia nevei]|uniref:tetratricopeptide repeat protein n=1 Tax=Serratia nevei TaxID=2703794 RepID=UPI00313C04C7
MNNNESVFIDSLKLILEYGRWPAAIIFIAWMFKKPIIEFLNRFEYFKFNNGDSSVEAGVSKESKKNPSEALNPPIQKPTETQTIEVEEKEDEAKTSWIAKTRSKILENDLTAARDIFEQHSKTVQSADDIHSDKSFLLYMIYEHTLNPEILKELEIHNQATSNEDQIISSSVWYIMCLEVTKQYDASITFLLKTLGRVKNSKNITTVTVNLADSYISNLEFSEAKKILTNRLQLDLSAWEYSRLYDKLSLVESKAGNDILSVLCLDKALEYDSTDKSLMFNSAYKASKVELRPIEISNYDTLVFSDPNNSQAINNIGVSASKVNLNSIATKYYETSSQLGNTLAMSNKGHKLAQTGFINQAEDIAKKALEHENPDENIYSLLEKIQEIRKSESEKWNEIKEKSFVIKRKLRKYTDAYYDAEAIHVEGEWFTSTSNAITVEAEDNYIFNIEYEDKKKACKIKINTSIVNRSLSGTYQEIYPKSEVSLLSAARNKSIKILGYLDKKSRELVFFSDNIDDDVELCLSRKS